MVRGNVLFNFRLANEVTDSLCPKCLTFTRAAVISNTAVCRLRVWENRDKNPAFVIVVLGGISDGSYPDAKS
jgi:hypothetical protein